LSRAERDGDKGNQATRAAYRIEGGKSFTARLCRLLFLVRTPPAGLARETRAYPKIAVDETLRAGASRRYRQKETNNDS